ncbi:unnamed protein product [Symbiodinium sp. CCMP2592]|nr:unnamed protein product [Symbiodinium sp. CCMP2592]CAE7354204.1 unnamed protein product [Symbiodinium sp. CCMP2592]CAE7504500.1 unnamed protein product [Symbiodinium sp. CCMP2592]CAE7635779.1 unnamed protein product [Symbiodinium sp. CCMP2592]
MAHVNDGRYASTPRERAKRELVDRLVSLEKRQREDETTGLDAADIADLGRGVLRGQYLRAWQKVIAAQPRWVWENEDETPEDEKSDASDLEDMEIGDGVLRAAKAALVRLWRHEVAENDPELTQRQLGGRQGAYLRGLANFSWRDTLDEARRRLGLVAWKRWVEQVRIMQGPRDP